MTENKTIRIHLGQILHAVFLGRHLIFLDSAQINSSQNLKKEQQVVRNDV